MQTMFEELKQLASVDLFAESRKEDAFVGRPFYLDYDRLRLMSNDKWKQSVGGVPAGAFLLALYNGEAGSIDEALLLRVLRPTKLPTDDDMVMAMVDHYKEAPRDGSGTPLDSYTRSEFQFSGLECRVIGTFYRDENRTTRFAGDLDNFYAPHNYRVVKPTGKILEYIVNFREQGIPGGKGDERIGKVRYSSSLRHQTGDEVPVYVSALDFLGKRTALFGMTRTGKSNSVKKIIQATVGISGSGVRIKDKPVLPVGQIIFDINGEYANANQQDDGTAIYEQYPREVTRYSVLEKPGFKVMKLNFHRSIVEGHGLLAGLLDDDTSTYTRAFCSIDWTEPDPDDYGAKTRFGVKEAAYQACLKQAGFGNADQQVTFKSNKVIMESKIPGLDGVDPSKGISIDDAVAWFTAAWENYDEKDGPFQRLKRENKGGRDWADEDTQTLMRFLTRKAKPGGAANEAGFRKLIKHRILHTDKSTAPFEDEIVSLLRAGKIVILDLSQGNPEIQRTYSDRVSRKIFNEAMDRFINNNQTNFIQMYFEEAHNLFPRKDDKDLTQIYNRLAKEGQKLWIGLCYATQEVSSISSSILKNTQNWFVSHLNNRDELRELDKYYDFEDFTDSLRRTIDKGFIRLKIDSNTFIVPIQVDPFKVSGA
ncbi:ATP-binding protein [Streptomyces sp. NPDC058330]|uniref:ATP-binding protein n=1 Tax=Streptomyces sp. NPDC058330 TaxID=3346449 RepID=UPI0036ED52A1